MRTKYYYAVFNQGELLGCIEETNYMKNLVDLIYNNEDNLPIITCDLFGITEFDLDMENGYTLHLNVEPTEVTG